MSSSSSPPNKITLSAPGPRELVTPEQAAQIVETWRAQLSAAPENAIVTKLDLSCRPFPPEAIKVLLPVLESIQDTLQELILDDIIASLETSLGIETIQLLATCFEQSTLKVLNVSDNALGIRCLETLGPLLQNMKQLMTFKARNCGLSAESCALLKEWLHPAHLHTIDLGRQTMGVQGAREIGCLLKQCVGLKELYYDGCRPQKLGSLAIIQGLRAAGVHLELLDLNDCSLGTGEEEDDPVHDLCHVIRTSRKGLHTLVLTEGALTADGLSSVLNALMDDFDEAISSVGALVKLDLGGNELGPEGATTLVEWLQQQEMQQPTLQELLLDTNEFEDEGVETIVTALAGGICPALTLLSLNENELEQDGFQALCDNTIPTLQTLFVKENNEEDLQDDGVLDTLRALYPRVIVTEEEENEMGAPVVTDVVEEEPDAAVDDLADMLGGAAI